MTTLIFALSIYLIGVIAIHAGAIYLMSGDDVTEEERAFAKVAIGNSYKWPYVYIRYAIHMARDTRKGDR